MAAAKVASLKSILKECDWLFWVNKECNDQSVIEKEGLIHSIEGMTFLHSSLLVGNYKI